MFAFLALPDESFSLFMLHRLDIALKAISFRCIESDSMGADLCFEVFSISLGSRCHGSVIHADGNLSMFFFYFRDSVPFFIVVGDPILRVFLPA